MFSGASQSEVLIHLNLFDSYYMHNEIVLMSFQKDNSGRKKLLNGEQNL